MEALTKWRNDTHLSDLEVFQRRVAAEMGYSLLILVGSVETFIRFFLASIVFLMQPFLQGAEGQAIASTCTVGFIGNGLISLIATVNSCTAIFFNPFYSVIEDKDLNVIFSPCIESN